MGWLFVVGLYKINGVVEIYFDLMVILIFVDFVCIFLECFINVINGIILCCWLVVVNL